MPLRIRADQFLGLESHHHLIDAFARSPHQVGNVALRQRDGEGELESARNLWQTLRYDLRERGNCLLPL